MPILVELAGCIASITARLDSFHRETINADRHARAGSARQINADSDYVSELINIAVTESGSARATVHASLRLR